MAESTTQAPRKATIIAGATPPARDELLTINGVRTHVMESGQGEPVVFLHGAGLASTWLPFHAMLAEHVHLYAPAHLGYGLTDKPEWFDGMDDLVFHTRDLLDQLGLKQVTLIGYSLGGWLAAVFAEWYPERVKRLVLLDAAGLRVPGVPIADVFAMTPQEFFQISFEDMAAGLSIVPQEFTIDLQVQAFRELGTLARIAWVRGYEPKLQRRLYRLTMPTRILWGEKDRLVPLAHGEAYQHAIPGSQLEIIPGAGHGAPVERPQILVEKLVAFFSEPLPGQEGHHA